MPNTGSWRSTAGLVAALGWLTACEPKPAPEPDGPVLLAELDRWERVVDAGDDVFGDERPVDVVCDETLGILLESLGAEPVLEINTDLCNYATVRQPSLVALVPGDTVTLRLWHYPLVAAMPSEAYVGLAIDGEVVWEQALPIPAEEGYVDGEFTVGRELKAGVELQLHIHNHGNNTYALLGIEADPTGER